MLSQKLQDDLMTAYQKVYEEKRGHAAGSDDTEKQASQLASDVRYKAKKKVPAGASKEEKRKIFLSILASSPAPAVVKSMAKQKLLGESIDIVEKQYRYSNVPEGIKDKKGAMKTTKKVVKGGLDAAKKVAKGVSGIAKREGTLSQKVTGAAIDAVKGGVRRLEKFANEEKIIEGAGSKIGSAVIDTVVKDSGVAKEVGGVVSDAIRSKRNLLRKIRGEKPIKEGSAYGIYKGDGKVKIGQPTRKQKGAMAYDGPNKERSEAADRVLAKTAAKRAKMKEEVEQINELETRTMLNYIDKASDSARKQLNKAEKTTSRKKKEKYHSKMDKRESGIEMAKDKIMKRVKEEFVDEMAAPLVRKPPKEKKMSLSVLDNIRKTNTGAGSQYEQVVHEKMDPVGQEDGDINNDGKKDGTDKYLASRRKAIGKAIAKKRGRVKEGFSAWRVDLDFNEQVKK